MSSIHTENAVATLWQSMKEKLTVVLVTSVVAVGTIFSDRILASIKVELYKVDQRPVQQEQIAKDVSILVFGAENAIEFARMNLTSKAELHFVVDPYNLAVETVRKNEYVYRAAVERYWDTQALDLYEQFMVDVRVTDSALHAFNEEYSQVESGIKSKADPVKLKPLLPPATAAVERLQHSAKDLLSALSK